MTFDEAFTKLLGNEGGYTLGVGDQGGETKFGISKRAHPTEKIPDLTIERAKSIYLRDYWGPAGCDAVPDALKYPLFDMAVNQGVGAAVRALQRALGEVEDGIVGPRTAQAAQSAPWQRTLLRFDAARLVAYTEVDDARWQRFGRGWVRRVARTMAEA